MEPDINPRRLIALSLFGGTAALGVLAFVLDLVLPFRDVDYSSWRALILASINFTGLWLLMNENKPLPKFMTRDRNEDGTHD